MTDQLELPPLPEPELTYWQRALIYADQALGGEDIILYEDAIAVLKDTVLSLVSDNHSIESINATILSTVNSFRSERDQAIRERDKFRSDLVLLGVLDAL